MSDTESPTRIEFIRLNGFTVRVTSWRVGGEPGTFDLVTITRGSRDAETLDDLFRQPGLALEIDGLAVRPVTAVSIDRRTVGEGQAGITRYAVTLADADGGPEPGPEPSTPTHSLDGRVGALEEQVATLEAELRDLRALILTHANGVRH